MIILSLDILVIFLLVSAYLFGHRKNILITEPNKIIIALPKYLIVIGLLGIFF